MSNDLKLFRVAATQTWTATAEALVLAPNVELARIYARNEVDLDIFDAQNSSVEISLPRREPMDILIGLTPQKVKNLRLIMPIAGRPFDAHTVELDQFLAELTPELLENLRIDAIERNNGQLPLLEAVT